MSNIKNLIFLAQKALNHIEVSHSSFDISNFHSDVQQIVLENFNKNKSCMIKFISILEENSYHESFTKDMCEQIPLDDYLFISENISTQADLILKNNNKVAMLVTQENHPEANFLISEIFNSFWPISDAKSDFFETYNKYCLK